MNATEFLHSLSCGLYNSCQSTAKSEIKYISYQLNSFFLCSSDQTHLHSLLLEHVIPVFLLVTVPFVTVQNNSTFLPRSDFVLRLSLHEQCQVCVRCHLGWAGIPVAPPGHGWCPSACIPTIPLCWAVLWCGSRSAPVSAALAEPGGIHKLFIQITMP